MMAAELYKKTLADYEASLGKGESMSLSRYCKIHHVNNQGLRYWMKKHSIDPPRNKPGKVTPQSAINHISQPAASPHHMMPLLIQPAIGGKVKTLTRGGKSSLKDVNITTQSGLVVCIPQISCADLAGIILTCNTR